MRLLSRLGSGVRGGFSLPVLSGAELFGVTLPDSFREVVVRAFRREFSDNHHPADSLLARAVLLKRQVKPSPSYVHLVHSFPLFFFAIA